MVEEDGDVSQLRGAIKLLWEAEQVGSLDGLQSLVGVVDVLLQLMYE